LSEGIDAGAKASVGNAALGAVPKLKAFAVALNTALGPIGWAAIALSALIGIITGIVSAV